MKYVFSLAFLVLIIIQWVVPGKVIWKKKQVIEKGRSYKFQTEPVDPSNPFKGKYITLNFSESSFTDTVNRHLVRDQNVYVILGADRKGFVTINDLSSSEPKTNTVYVKATVYYTSIEKDSTTVHINYPFNEFYMDEYKAPKAENIYRESSRDSSSNTYALVKIWKGQAVIQDVFVNDISIRLLIK